MRQRCSGPIGLEYTILAILLALVATSLSAPVYENTELEPYNESGCYYNYNHYSEGDRIMTNEPCLNCTCHNRMLMCYLRVCPFTKPIGEECTVEKREDQCCPIITCPEVHVELVDTTASTDVGSVDRYGCQIESKFYAEGAQVPSNPKKPCELCYCIRNATSCVMQECTLHVDGCRPIYNKGVCCPVRYECDHDGDDDTPLMIEDNGTTTTTTMRPTEGFRLPTTTTAPASSDCMHGGELFADGALIFTDEPCEHCYCMRGDIVCAVQECMTPLENEGKNCSALPPKAGECCPDTYDCVMPFNATIAIAPTTEASDSTATVAPMQFDQEGNEMNEDGTIKTDKPITDEVKPTEASLMTVTTTITSVVEQEKPAEIPIEKEQVHTSEADPLVEDGAGETTQTEEAAKPEESEDATTLAAEEPTLGAANSTENLPKPSDGEEILPTNATEEKPTHTDEEVQPDPAMEEVKPTSTKDEITPTSGGDEINPIYVLAEEDIMPTPEDKLKPIPADEVINHTEDEAKPTVADQVKPEDSSDDINSTVAAEESKPATPEVSSENTKPISTEDDSNSDEAKPTPSDEEVMATPIESYNPEESNEEVNHEQSNEEVKPTKSSEEKPETSDEETLLDNRIEDEKLQDHIGSNEDTLEPTITPVENTPVQHLPEHKPTVSVQADNELSESLEIDTKTDKPVLMDEVKPEIPIEHEADNTVEPEQPTTHLSVDKPVDSNIDTETTSQGHDDLELPDREIVTEDPSSVVKMPEDELMTATPLEIGSHTMEENKPTIFEVPSKEDETTFEPTASAAENEDKPTEEVDKTSDEVSAHEEPIDDEVKPTHEVAMHDVTEEVKPIDDIKPTDEVNKSTEDSLEPVDGEVRPTDNNVLPTEKPITATYEEMEPSENAVTPTELENKPAYEEEMPAKEVTQVEVDDNDKPTEEIKPTEETPTHVEEETKPTENIMIPNAEPTDEKFTTDAVQPIEDGETSAEYETTPEVKPTDEVKPIEDVKPAEEEIKSAEEEATPAVEATDVVKPIDDEPTPVGEEVKPFKEAATPEGETSDEVKPIEDAITTIGDEIKPEDEPSFTTGHSVEPTIATISSDLSSEDAKPTVADAIPTINDEIGTETPLAAFPSSIPGEGSCLIMETTYQNGEVIPTSNKCQKGCICTNSVIRCEARQCAEAPSNDCKAFYANPDDCCPSFECSEAEHEVTATPTEISTHEKETVSSMEEKPVEGSSVAPTVVISNSSEEPKGSEEAQPEQPELSSESAEEPASVEHQQDTSSAETPDEVKPTYDEELSPSSASDENLPEPTVQTQEELVTMSQEAEPTGHPDATVYPSKEVISPDAEKPVDTLAETIGEMERPEPTASVNEDVPNPTTHIADELPVTETTSTEVSEETIIPLQDEINTPEEPLPTSQSHEESPENVSGQSPDETFTTRYDEESVTSAEKENEPTVASQETPASDGSAESEEQEPTIATPTVPSQDIVPATESVEEAHSIEVNALAPSNHTEYEPTPSNDATENDSDKDVPLVNPSDEGDKNTMAFEEDHAELTPDSTTQTNADETATEQKETEMTNVLPEAEPTFVPEVNTPTQGEEGNVEHAPEPTILAEPADKTSTESSSQSIEDIAGDIKPQPTEETTDNTTVLTEIPTGDLSGEKESTPQSSSETIVPLPTETSDEKPAEDIIPANQTSDQPITLIIPVSSSEKPTTSYEQTATPDENPAEENPEEPMPTSDEHISEEEEETHPTEISIAGSEEPVRTGEKPIVEEPTVGSDSPLMQSHEEDTSAEATKPTEIIQQETSSDVDETNEAAKPTDTILADPMPTQDVVVPTVSATDINIEEENKPVKEETPAEKHKPVDEMMPEPTHVADSKEPSTVAADEESTTPGVASEQDETTDVPVEHPKPAEETKPVDETIVYPTKEESKPIENDDGTQILDDRFNEDTFVSKPTVDMKLEEPEPTNAQEFVPETPTSLPVEPVVAEEEPTSTAPITTASTTVNEEEEENLEPTKVAEIEPEPVHTPVMPSYGETPAQQMPTSDYGSHTPGYQSSYPPPYGPEDDYADEEDSTSFGPGTCRYGGKLYVSAQQIPRDDPCDFCFCFRSDIICLQQSCPPPISGCHEEPISGFCCPRYECPVSMATVLNITTSTTTTTTTLPPLFNQNAYKGKATRAGCMIDGKSYQVGELVQKSSGPCMNCICDGDGKLKCDPKVCSPEPLLRQMIAVAASRRRR